MKKGQTELVIILILVAMITIPTMSFLTDVETSRTLKQLPDDMQPVAESRFTAASITDLYLRPELKYSMYRATDSVLRDNESWDIDSIPSQEQVAENIAEHATAILHHRLDSISLPGSCTFQRGGPFQFSIQNTSISQPTHHLVFDAAKQPNPYTVTCEGEDNTATIRQTLRHRGNQTGNRALHLINLTRAIATNTTLQTALTGDDITASEQQDMLQRVITYYTSSYLTEREDFTGITVTTDHKPGDNQFVINATDTQYTLPTRDGYRNLKIWRTIVYE